MNHKSNDIIEDFKPRSWLSRYRKTTISYLLILAFFYYGIGVILQIFVNGISPYVISGYVGPNVPYSLSIGLSSGPLEETLFFGLPYYATGNAHLMMVTGAAWSIGHIFNTETFELANLAFGNFGFTVPLVFFSIRTWTSGKGWFAIMFHSGWNVAFLSSLCFTESNCIVIGSGWYLIGDLMSIIGAILLVIATYRVYKIKSNLMGNL